MPAPDWKQILRDTPRDKPVYVAGGCAEPTALLNAAQGDPDLLAGRTIVSGHLPRVNIADPTAGAPGARLLSIFPCPSKAEATLLPWPYSRMYQWLATPGSIGLALCQLSRTPDGALSLGLSADFMPALLEAGVPVIAQLNPAHPTAATAPKLGLDRVAAVIEAQTGLPEYDDGTPDDANRRIGEHIAGLVRPGATLQLGLGRVQAAILEALLADPRPLTLHGGMMSGRGLALLDAGIARSATAGVLLGRRADYDRAPELTTLHLKPVAQTHGAAALSQHRMLVSANAILSIDLAGQATGESIAGRTVSAPGGLPDFHRAALASPDGCAIAALRATTPAGHSSIVATHPAGTRISLPALDADIVVTEHGIARLKHLGTTDRARSLIAIAAPQHRDALNREWNANG